MFICVYRRGCTWKTHGNQNAKRTKPQEFGVAVAQGIRVWDVFLYVFTGVGVREKHTATKRLRDLNPESMVSL